MRVYHSLEDTKLHAPIVLTVGAFDGIHRGHQYLIEQVRAGAAEIGGESAVLTFDPHPDLILHPERRRLYLTPPQQRVALFAELGVDHLFVLRFDQALAKVPAEEFMARVCSAMNLRQLRIGPDFRLGAGGRGTADVLRAIGDKLGYTVYELDRVLLDGEPVSSTLIRDMLHAGRVDEAARLLGRPFSLQGEVVHGDHRGRTIGVPTANLAVAAEQLLPADGVYACLVGLPDTAGLLPAATNIGMRPTFGTLRRTVETHLIDWSGDLYGATIRILFVQRLRGEQKFSGVEALIAQIQADVSAARAILIGQELPTTATSPR